MDFQPSGLEIAIALIVTTIAFAVGYYISRRRAIPVEIKNHDLENEVNNLKTAVQNSESRFHQVASSISDAIYVARISKKGELKFVYLSPNIEPITGYNPDFFMQSPDFGRVYVHPEDRHIIQSLVHHLGEGKDDEVDYRWVHGRKGVIWLRNSGRVVQDDHSSNITIYGLISDVTERKRIEEDLNSQKRLFENLLVVAQATTGHSTMKDTLRSILDIIMMLIDVPASSRSSLFVFDDKGVMASTLLSQGEHVYQRKRQFIAEVIDKGLVGWVVKNRQKALLFDTSADDRWLPLPEDSNSAQSALSVPIMSGASLLAVLTMTHPDVGYFTMDHAYMLESASNQIALSVRNAQMHNIETQQADRQQTLYDTLRAISSHHDPKEVAKIAANIVSERTHWPAVEILLPDDSRERFIVAAATGIGATNKGFAITLDKGIVGRALRLDETQYVPDVKQDPDYVMADTNIITELVVPLVRSERMLGALNLLSDEWNAFDQDDILLAESLAEAMALALDNAGLHKDLLSAKEAAESANMAKSEFISVVSHELKNPMTSIRGYADLLSSGVVGEMSPQQENFIQTIGTNVGRMQTLVSDLTDVSRIESGHVHMDFDAVPLVDVVGDVVRTMRAQMESKNQDLVITTDDNLPLVWGDRNRLIQIMTNLLSNAYKYTPENGRVEICLRNQLHANNGANESVVLVSVIDDGIGISEEDQKKMFEKFYRAPDREARSSPGTGLGLNITKNLVELQNGRIWFESEFRKGTTFHFTIPIAEDE